MTDYVAAYRARVAAEVGLEAAAVALGEALPVAYDAGVEDGYQAAWGEAVAFLRAWGSLGARDAADDLEAEGMRRAARRALGEPIGDPHDWPGDTPEAHDGA